VRGRLWLAALLLYLSAVGTLIASYSFGGGVRLGLLVISLPLSVAAVAMWLRRGHS
jgi:hypothetical protein